MQKIMSAAKSRSESDPLFMLMSTAAGVSFAASAIAFAGFVFLVS